MQSSYVWLYPYPQPPKGGSTIEMNVYKKASRPKTSVISYRRAPRLRNDQWKQNVRVFYPDSNPRNDKKATKVTFLYVKLAVAKTGVTSHLIVFPEYGITNTSNFKCSIIWFEFRKLTATTAHFLNTFQNRCLSRILEVFRPNIITVAQR